MRLWAVVALVLVGCGGDGTGEAKQEPQGIAYGGACEAAAGGDPYDDCRQPDGYTAACWTLPGMASPRCVIGAECNLEADPADTAVFTEAECKALGGVCRYPEGGSGEHGSFCYPAQ